MPSLPWAEAKKNTPSPSSATGIDSHFFFTGKWKSLLWWLWRFPAVFSYFMTWWKAPLLFFRHKDENKRNVGEIFFWRVSRVCCCCLFKKRDTRVLKEDFQRYDKHVDLTHLTSSVSSTLGNMMAGGRTAACRMTCRSASAKPLDTEFTLTHFSVRPKSSSVNILGIVSRASVCKTQDTQEQSLVKINTLIRF